MSEVKLPRGWETVTLDKISKFVIGGDWGKDPDKFWGEDFVEVACIRGSEIKNWGKEKGKTASIRLIKESSLEKRELIVGDLLIEISGGGPDQPVGRVVRIDEEALSHHPKLPKVGTNFLRLLRIVDDVDNSYVNYYLQYFYHSGEVVKYQGGSNNLRNLKYKEYSKIDIPLAPLPEQQHIVARLDAVFGHLDVLKEKLDRIPVLLKNFRQQVLTQAVTGELTKEWREYSSFKGEKNSEAEEIIERLNKKRESLVKLKKIRKVILKETDKNDNLGDLPNSWVKVSLIEVANIIDPNPSHRMPEYVNDGIPFISTENIKGSQLDFQKGKKVTQRTLDEQIKRFDIKEGDFLFTRIGTIGKSCYLPTMREYALSHAVCIISSYLPDQLHPSFLKIILSSKVILDQSQDGIQSVGVPDLGMGKVRAFQIPLTSVEEQQEVVNIVEALGSLADKIESQYHSLKSKIDQLPQAVLAKAFRGELVEQKMKEYVRGARELGMVAEKMVEYTNNK
ncbi:restriction endonuclease subunit S [Algoriphagus marinus]|uniref:restriction endonuclease subunit S n=1 Tax=Algoriphagus marinus TaxID=1925762 RepID=UPI00094B968B|nr:restriction endonuclease subunit S [Algoriphagus marinus]